MAESEGSIEDPLRLFASYQFDSDDVFQQGLASVFAGSTLEGKSGSERDEMVHRARVFYFNRMTGSSLTPESAAEYQRSISDTNDTPPRNLAQPEPVEEEDRTLSVAELKALIEEGKTDQIPNNRVISIALNDALPSQSTTQPRRKPWETS